MNFFGIGAPEIAVIAVLALIVIGPQQLPSLLKQMGGWFSKAQDMQRELRRGIDDIAREADLQGVTKTISAARNFTPVGAATSLLDQELAKSDAKASKSSASTGDAGATTTASGTSDSSAKPSETKPVAPKTVSDSSTALSKSDDDGASAS